LAIQLPSGALNLKFMIPKFFDTHSHIQFSQFDDDRNEVIERMCNENVAAFVVGTDKESSEKAVALASAHDNLYAIIGIHPTDQPKDKYEHTFLTGLAQNDKVVGIGECGLDYFRSRSNSEEEKQRQKKLFKNHIELALAVNLPLMLHCRPSEASVDAYDDVLDILGEYIKEHGEKIRGNVHFFVGDLLIAKKFLEIGFTLSFTGVITFASNYDEVIKYTPVGLSCSPVLCDKFSGHAHQFPY